jgi:site-specific DNA-cytosine methylase
VKEIQPKYFLLENVKMKKEFQDVISGYMWVEPIEIDSALVSAQRRKRLYWTNIPWITQPKDKWIMLKDILESNAPDKYNLTERGMKMLMRNFGSKWQALNFDPSVLFKITYPSVCEQQEWLERKCPTLTASMGTWWWNVPCIIQKVWDRDKNQRWVRTDKSYTLPANPMSDRWQMVVEPMIAYAPWSREFEQQWFKTWKAPTLCARDYKDPKVVLIPTIVRVRKYEVDTEKLKSELRNRKFTSHLSCKEIADKLWVPQTKAEHRFRLDNSFAIPDPEIRFQLKELLEINTSKFDKSITEFEEREWTYEKADRKIPVEWKMTTLTASWNDDIIEWCRVRKLTPIECERLQTLPDNYTEGVSDTQRYKSLGNGRTVDVIAHIFSFINK